MRVFVQEPPEPVVTWADADAHLKLDGDTTQKDEVEGFIAAAIGHLDGPTGWLGRAIGVQTLEARFSVFLGDACRTIRLPYPPAIDLTSVEWLGSDGVLIPGNVADLELLGNDLVPAASSFPWEGGSQRREAVRLRYRAGYQVLPAPIRAAILLMTGDLYRNRDTVSTGGSQAVQIPMSTTVENLLAPFRVFS